MATEKREIRKGPKVAGTAILTVVAVAAVIFGSSWLVSAVKYVSTDDAAVDGKQVKLSSKMLGRIERIATSEGKTVGAGDLLVTLDGSDLKAQEAQAAASLAYARENLGLARINRDKAAEDSNRVKDLYRDGAATRETYEHAGRTLEAAEAQYSIAQAQIDTANAQLGVIETQLLNTGIKSPIAGTVDKITLSEGDVVQPGQTILSVNNLGELWVTANLEETKIGRIAEGAKVKVTIDSWPGKAFTGTVEMIRSGILPPSFQIGEFTKTVQRIPVRIKLDPYGEGIRLLPGMSCEVKIRSSTPLPALLDR